MILQHCEVDKAREADDIDGSEGDLASSSGWVGEKGGTGEVHFKSSKQSHQGPRQSGDIGSVLRTQGEKEPREMGESPSLCTREDREGHRKAQKGQQKDTKGVWCGNANVNVLEGVCDQWGIVFPAG